VFIEVADIAQSDLVNSRTFKDLWNEIQGLLSTCPVFRYFQGIEFRRKIFKYFQGCVGTLLKVCSDGNDVMAGGRVFHVAGDDLCHPG